MMRTARLAVLALIGPLASAAAQRTVVGLSGTVFRYHGDTIWLERDSTTQVSITHGDTVETFSRMNGVERGHVIYVVEGQSAWTIRNGVRSPRALPASAATSLNSMLELELKNENTVRLMESNPFMARAIPAASPETTTTYAVSPAVRIVQHRDTVTYIRGCEGAQRDTTVFLLFGRDSAKRVTKPERMFGQGMAMSLFSQMRLSLMQDFAATVQGPLPPDMPKTPGGCQR